MRIDSVFVQALLISLFMASDVLAAGVGRSVAECQQVLLAGKVANGEFPEEILEKALNLRGQVFQYFYDGSGYWFYMRDQAKAWVPGEWSIIVKHKEGVEYHQRTLLPYGLRK